METIQTCQTWKKRNYNGGKLLYIASNIFKVLLADIWRQLYFLFPLTFRLLICKNNLTVALDYKLCPVLALLWTNGTPPLFWNWKGLHLQRIFSPILPSFHVKSIEKSGLKCTRFFHKTKTLQFIPHFSRIQKSLTLQENTFSIAYIISSPTQSWLAPVPIWVTGDLGMTPYLMITWKLWAKYPFPWFLGMQSPWNVPENIHVLQI